MNIAGIAGAAITVAILSLTLRYYKQEYSVFIGLAAAVALLLIILPQVSVVLAFVDTVSARGIDLPSRLRPVLRALGVAFITQTAADTCRDCGENALAAKVELAGKCAILVIALPLMQELLSLVTGLLN